MAPEAGFEPAEGCPSSVFETDTFGHSVIPAYGFRQDKAFPTCMCGFAGCVPPVAMGLLPVVTAF